MTSNQKYIGLTIAFVIYLTISLIIILKHPDSRIIVRDSDDYDKYLKQVSIVNKKIDSIKTHINSVKLEKTIIKEKYYYEKKKIATYDVNQFDSIIRLYSNIK